MDAYKGEILEPTRPVTLGDTGSNPVWLAQASRSSSGKDAGLSSRKEEFNSPTCYCCTIWPHRISASSPPFQGEKMGSIPIGATVAGISSRDVLIEEIGKRHVLTGNPKCEIRVIRGCMTLSPFCVATRTVLFNHYAVVAKWQCTSLVMRRLSVQVRSTA